MKNIFLVLFCFTTVLGFSQANKENIYTIDNVDYEIQKDGESSFIVKNNDDTLFLTIETMPEFPGGQSELFKYLGNNVKFPPAARNNGIQGKVYVNFSIMTNGSIEEVKTINKVHPLLDSEAIRVINSMPNWSPGIQKGKKVKVNYIIPINFVIQNGNPGSDNRAKGLKYLNKGDYENSIYYYSKIIKVKKNDIDLLLHRGMAYHKFGKDKKAIKDLEKAKKLGSKKAVEYLKTIQQ